MDVEEIEVSAKTIEDAVMEAAVKLVVPSEKVAYEVINPGTTGFFGIGGKKAVIRARVKTEEEMAVAEKAEQEMEKIHQKIYSEQPAAEEETKTTEKENVVEERPAEKSVEKPVQKQPKSEKKSAEKKTAEKKPVEKKQQENKPAEKKSEQKPAEKVEPLKVPVDTTKVEHFLSDIFTTMGMNVNINISQNLGEREIYIDLAGDEDDMGVLIGKRGQTLDSIQYLSSLVVNRDSDVYIRVKVDTENYRERRKATLENLARNMGSKVSKTGKAVTLEPMNPYERRVIHSALQNDRYVTTHSEGEEPNRYVVITLKEGVRPSGGNRNRGRNNRNRRGGYNNNKKRER